MFDCDYCQSLLLQDRLKKKQQTSEYFHWLKAKSSVSVPNWDEGSEEEKKRDLISRDKSNLGNIWMCVILISQKRKRQQNNSLNDCYFGLLGSWNFCKVTYFKRTKIRHSPGEVNLDKQFQARSLVGTDRQHRLCVLWNRASSADRAKSEQNGSKWKKSQGSEKQLRRAFNSEEEEIQGEE